jgi:hypothetical protein
MKVAGRRPDLVIADDPQTDESADSLTQVKKRERVMGKAVLGLAGPKVQIAALCPCTVICPGDLADRVLDPKRHPMWQGERMKMVYAFPEAAELWAEYRRVQVEGGPDAATAFYKARRAEMDRGAKVAWPERFPEGKLSAVQHAMDLYLDDRASFMAECQNEPEEERDAGEVVELDAAEVAAKVNGLPRGVVPPTCSLLTAGVDVQKEVIFATVTAWDASFGGSVIDYLAFPKQSRAHFTAADPRPRLSDLFPNLTEEGRIYAGLKAAADLVLSRTYAQDGTGNPLPVSLALVDSGDWTDTVYSFCRLSPFAARLRPSKGRGIKAGDRPMSEWRADPRRDVVGQNWRIDADTPARHVLVDTNSWKSFVAGRLAAAPTVPGSLILNGDGKDRREHELFAEHVTAAPPPT